VADSITRQLQNKEKDPFLTIFVEFNEDPLQEELERIPGAEKVMKVKEKNWLVQSNASMDIRPAIFSFAVENNLMVLSMHKQEKKLEEVFRELTS
jgi:ABC-type multidrug transport system ATPase subunit